MASRRRKLRTKWQRVRNTPGMGRDVLVFTVVAAMGLVAAGLILVNQNFSPPWRDTFQFAAEFREAPAISPDSDQEVRIAGVRVGNVDSAAATKNGRAKVTMSIEPGTPIYRNARLVLRPKNQLNEMYIEVDPGGPPAKKLAPGGALPVSQTQRPVQADEVLQHLDQRTRSALTDLLSESDTALARAPERLPGGLRATNSTMVAVQPVLKELRERKDKIQRLVTDLARVAAAAGNDSERLSTLADATQRTLTTLAARQKDVADALEKLPGVGRQLRASLTDTQDLTSQLDPTLDNLKRASGELPPALSRLSETVDQLRPAVRAAKPVVRKAGPVVANLRPLVGNVDSALDDLRPVTVNLPRDTKVLVPYLDDLQAFVYNTSSLTGTSDANGGIIRGDLALAPPGTAGPLLNPVLGGKLPSRGEK